MSSDQLTTCFSDKNNNRVKQTNCIENNLNMVVSLPINVVGSNQTVLVLNNHNLSTTTTPALATNVTSVTTQQQEIGTTNTTMPSSKYLLLDKNQIIGSDAENYADIVNGIGNLQNGNENSGGGIVVLATQQINTQSQNQTDEELTPLTWLHDKNLLKGINLSCSKIQSIPSSPQRHMSPTSDFLEDSCVSEENSSINSNSDNGVHSELNYYTNQKVRNPGSNHHCSNESSTMSTSSSAPSSLSSPSSINSSPGAQTLIEYHTLSNSIIEDGSKMNNECSTSTIISPSSTLIPHQHFHKKYLREEHIRQLEHVGTTSSLGSNIINKTQFKHFINTPQGKYEIMEKEYPTTPSKLTPTYNRTISQEVTTTYSASPRQPNDLNGQTILSSTIHQHSNSLSPKHKSSNNMAYDPKIHTNNKPPYSFSSLIFMAIEDSPEKALPVKEIYAWIVQRFPYFKTAPTGWKNSVRHNLSLSKSFQKVEKAPNMGKGSLWRVDKHYRHNLVQTVSRSQMHPCATIEKTSMKSVPRPSNSPPMLDEIPSLVQNGHNGIVMQNGQNGARALDAELFPRLSRYMAQMTTSNGTVIERPSPSSTPIDDDYTQNYRNADDYYHKISNGYATNNNCNNTIANNNNCALFANRNFSPDRLARDFDTENIDDVNAAKAMLALKHGPKVFGENYHSPIITSSPSEDHTYSQGVNSANGVNNSGTELNNNTIESSISVRLVDHQIHSDNNSNGTSSDAAYESSEEGHHHHHHRSDITHTKNNRNSNNNLYVKPINHNNINNNNNILTNAETEEQRRHAEGVDALLNLAGVSVTFTTPITLKRLSTTSLTDIQHQNNHSSNSNNNSSNIIYQHSPSKKVKTKSVRNKLRKSFGEIK